MSENLLNTLEVGRLIEVEWKEENGVSKSLRSEILDIPAENKCILSVPFFKGRFYVLHTGMRYQFAYNKQDAGVFQFQGLILGREQIGKQHAVVVLRVSEFQKSQRRLYYRLAVLIDAYLLVEDGEATEKIVVNGKVEEQVFVQYKKVYCPMKDISGGGARIQSSKPFEIGSSVLLLFDLGGDSFKLTADVKRCQLSKDIPDRYELGLGFDNIEETDRSKIIAFIFDKQRNLLKKGLI